MSRRDRESWLRIRLRNNWRLWAARAALPLAVIAVWIGMMLRWVLTDTVVPWDSKNQFYAFFRFLADSLHAGTSVFWNPYQYGGLPSIADPQSLIFSPPFLLWAWFDPSPSLRAFDVIVMAHLLVGGLAMVGLGARRQWPATASLMAATVFMLGGPASARLDHSCIIICYGLFPLALLLLETSFARRSISAAVAFALVAALIALGRNQVALMLCLALIALCIRLAVNAGAPLRYLRARWHLLLVIGIVGIAVTAVPVLLSLQLAEFSNRPHAELSEALLGSLHPANLASLAVADVFGVHSGGYWGPQESLTPDVASTDDSFNYLFVGVVPVLLLLWHGIAGARLSARGCRVFTLILLTALLFACGRYAPIFTLFYEHVPGFSFFRRPVDGTFVLPIAFAFLSGELLSSYVARGLPRPSPLGTALAVSGVVAVVVGVAGVSAITNHVAASLRACLPALAVLAASVAAFTSPATAIGRGRAAAFAAALTICELISWNAASRLNAESRAYYEVLETASDEDAEALRLLSSEIERRHREGARPRVEIVGLGGPWQNLAVIRKIEATTGYNPLRIGIYDRYVRPSEQGWFASSRKFPATFKGYDCDLARALGLEYLVLDRPIEKLKQQSRPSRLELLHAGPEIWIYHIPDALPRVHFSSRVEVADLDLTTSAGELAYPPAADRITVDDETPLAGRYVRSAMLDGVDHKAAVIKSWMPGAVEIEVDTPRSGVLVLHDLYYPGWTARIDGVRVPVLRADVLFRAVEVPAGRHTVVVQFEPLTFANLWQAVRQLVMPANPAHAAAG